MKVVRTITLTEFINRLRALGIPMSVPKAHALLGQGLFDGVAYRVSEGDYLILERRFEEWVARYAEEVELDPDIAAFAQAARKAP